jgi:hypothetical protein
MIPPRMFIVLDSFIQALLFMFVFGLVAILFNMTKAAVMGGTGRALIGMEPRPHFARSSQARSSG